MVQDRSLSHLSCDDKQVARKSTQDKSQNGKKFAFICSFAKYAASGAEKETPKAKLMILSLQLSRIYLIFIQSNY